MTKDCKSAFTGLTDMEDPAFAPRGDFHAMDCTDVVIGMVKDGLSRVVDSYTRLDVCLLQDFILYKS